MSNTITPPGGVNAFIKSFGGNNQVINAASAMGFKITPQAIRKWRVDGCIPTHFYNALSTVVIAEETTHIRDILEVYYKGKFLGQFHLDKDMSLAVKRRRDITRSK